MQEMAEDTGLIPGSRRFPRVANGNPLQYSCLENAWTEEPGGLQPGGLHGVEKNQTQLSTHTHI